jgi:hypothetical protein
MSEYASDFIRDCGRDRRQDPLVAVLLERIRSSEPSGTTPRDWDEIRSEGMKLAHARRAGNNEAAS